MHYSHEDIPDPLDEIFAQILKDFPDAPLSPAVVSPYSSSSFPQPLSASFSPPSALSPSSPPWTSSSSSCLLTFPRSQTPNTLSTCQWVSSNDFALICGARLSQDPKEVCSHFRNVHDIRGNEKVIIPCHWSDCLVAPMQRGSVIRHVLTVHLGLMRWHCEQCGKTLSRKGAVHVCTDDP